MRYAWTLVFALLFVTGCAKSPQSGAEIAKFVDRCGSSDIIITDIKGRKKADGFMQAQVSGENRSESYHLLEYRVVWYDKEGFKMDTILSKWNTVPAYAKQPFDISAVSPSDKARTFRIYIRKEKETICEKDYDGQ